MTLKDLFICKLDLKGSIKLIAHFRNKLSLFTFSYVLYFNVRHFTLFFVFINKSLDVHLFFMNECFCFEEIVGLRESLKIVSLVGKDGRETRGNAGKV